VAGFKLVYSDDALLVLDKPAGLLAVPGRGEDKQDCLSTRVQQVYPEALVVHRLDMATSGLLLMARSPAAQRALNLGFEKRQVHKRYTAVVHGRLEPPDLNHLKDGWGLIDLPLILDWLNRPRSIVDHATGKPSRTRWRVLAHDAAANATRVALEPVTGRSHQLRVHLQALGHPILGDPLYAPPEAFAAAPRLLLHAERLALFHPLTDQAMAFESPVPF
jgi:tRNA pseudouridine32 synthase/23S rRNA pseudouridine746 synthase